MDATLGIGALWTNDKIPLLPFVRCMLVASVSLRQVTFQWVNNLPMVYLVKWPEFEPWPK